MRAVLSWLQEFADLPSDPRVLGAAFDELGLVVEDIERVGAGLDDVIVARVVALRAHPDADRVQLVDVDAGAGDPIQVVCGAFNFSPGDLVPLARVGATLPGGFEIGARTVRGQLSNGMLCSAKELGLGDDHAGILVLSAGDGIAPGMPFAAAAGIEPDVVFDLDVTPNRPDALCMVGVARDAAAKLGVAFEVREPPPLAAAESDAPVVVRAKRHAPRFTSVVLDGASGAPSPDWMARRLTLAGMRPISNVVDVSNYVMLELGHPNHAYDRRRLGGGGLVVRTARAGERVTTLDGVERAMTTDDCLICDSDGAPVGIAGVMGGAAAEISSDTSELLLETAYFDAAAIARTSGRVALRTEASMRFERGVDPEGLARAAARFCALAAEVAGAEVRGGLADVRGRLPKRPRPLVRTARLNQILGTSLDADDVAALLAPIGFESVPGRGGVRVTVPTWRPDCTQEVDVVEEVARLYGYARIPRTVPGTAHVGGLDARQQFRRRLRDVLRGAGASEAWTTTFLAPDDIERAGLTVESVEVENPLVHEESRLRPSLLPGMLRAVSVNAAFRNPDVSLFEIGNVFTPAADAGVPVETERAAVALAGDDALAAGRLWRLIADALSLSGLRLERGVAEGLHPARTFVVYDGDAVAGVAGEVAPEVLAAYDIDGRVAWIDIAVEALRGAVDADRAYVPVSRFPSSDVDLAFVVADDVPAARVEETLRAAGGELLVDIRLFDVYRGERLGQGRRSLAYRLRFNAADHTLTDAEVGGLRQRCIDAVESSWPAHLRS